MPAPNRFRLLATCSALLVVLAMAASSMVVRAQDHDHARFNDHDRAVAHDWYVHHRTVVGFRDSDRLSPELEGRLQVGVTLGPQLRARVHPVPHDLLVTLTPAARGYRYVVIGGHICLVRSRDFFVVDVLHLELP